MKGNRRQRKRSAGIAGPLMDQARAYFLASGDRQSRFWIFRKDQPSRLPSSTFSCGSEKFRIEIIDPFSGRHPIVVSHQALLAEIQVPFRPTVILDSNIVSYLHQFVTDKSTLDNARRRVVDRFLKFVVGQKLDYNPFFYYMEGVLENERTPKQSYTQFSESMLRLQTMDGEYFLSSGRIRSDPRVLELYRQKYGTSDISEMALGFTENMIQPADVRTEWVSKLTYAALMKTALIHKTSKREVCGKYEELCDFMENTFNIALARERILALEYFAGRFDDAIPIQRGANHDRALKRLRASARDMLLLHLPEIMLVGDTVDGVYVSSVATADRALARVARACQIEAVMAWAPETHKPLPLLSVDLSRLEPDLDAKTVEKIREIDHRWQKSRIAQWSKPVERISFEILDAVIGHLEQEVIAYCTST